MNYGVLGILSIGFVLGLKHAIEADHLAAVSTIVADRRSIWASALVGASWGIGHTITLLIVASLAIVFKFSISPALEGKLEGFVGVMLVVLGLNALRKLFKNDKIHAHTHVHGERKHVHIHTHKNDENAEKLSHHLVKNSPRSILIGMVHGLAGSAALMLLIVPTINSPALALMYIAIFGIGSIGGMMLMSILMSLPIHFTAGRFDSFNKVLLCLAGVFSLGLGISIVYERFYA
ncbi:MAG: urease accessory protein [Pyrinomonadaceae bacterium]